jgi:uncharacterized protein (TIGR02328 family)
MLFEYHRLVMQEMIKRGFKVAYPWMVSQYRGNNCDAASYEFYIANHSYRSSIREPVYPEHDEAYMQECLEILRGMGIEIERDKMNDYPVKWYFISPRLGTVPNPNQNN